MSLAVCCTRTALVPSAYRGTTEEGEATAVSRGRVSADPVAGTAVDGLRAVPGAESRAAAAEAGKAKASRYVSVHARL